MCSASAAGTRSVTLELTVEIVVFVLETETHSALGSGLGPE
jgi:hypothetical protein